MERVMNFMSLANVQKQFWHSLNCSENKIHRSINEDDEFNSLARIDVYRTTARSIHVSVLANVFPVCKQILGHDYFSLIAKKYFHAHPSLSADLNDYGDQFPIYLAELIAARDELKDYLYLSDLAQLEWYIQKSHYSSDNKDLNIESINQQCESQGGHIIFSLQASVYFLKADYPIAEIWQLHQSDNPIDNFQISLQKDYICIYRDEYEVKILTINQHIYTLLLAIKQGNSLMVIAELFDSSEVLNSALSFIVARNWLLV